MTVEEAICARVASLTPVTAIVGTRVYLDKLPQGVDFPAVLVQLVDDDEGQHLRGPEGLKRARIQADVWTHEDSGLDVYTQAAALMAAVDGDGRGPQASGIFGWVGSIGSPAVTIQNCAHASGRLKGYDAEEMRVFRMTQDYYVTYRGV